MDVAYVKESAAREILTYTVFSNRKDPELDKSKSSQHILDQIPVLIDSSTSP
jgi:hypothetical protein